MIYPKLIHGLSLFPAHDAFPTPPGRFSMCCHFHPARIVVLRPCVPVNPDPALVFLLFGNDPSPAHRLLERAPPGRRPLEPRRPTTAFWAPAYLFKVPFQMRRSLEFNGPICAGAADVALVETIQYCTAGWYSLEYTSVGSVIDQAAETKASAETSIKLEDEKCAGVFLLWACFS
jgi:hypothetical protein